MEIKLNIYKNKKEVKKTYTATTYDLMWSTMEDFINIIDLDNLAGQNTDQAFISAVGKLLSGGLGQIKPLLLDVFDGLTEAELRNTKVKEVAAVIIQILKYSIVEIKGASTAKNA